MQDKFDFWTIGEPLGNLQSRFFYGREAHGERLQTAKGQAAVVGRNSAAHHLLRGPEALMNGVVTDGD